MIRKADILERASEWGLTPGVVEKDYVLGWLLAGISTHPGTRELWIFKGGTCLKKCILETYRFSEDLDFTLLPASEYSEAGIARILREITTRVTEWSGIQLPEHEISVLPRRDRRGRDTFEGRVGYVGPMALSGSLPKIRLDLTMHEAVIQAPARRAVFHPYPDELPTDARVSAYTFAELLAEKTRALCERARPRDLYDVIRLADVELSSGERAELRAVLRAKFLAKDIAVPSVDELVRLVSAAEEMRSEWENMLQHQLPALPPLDDHIARLPAAIGWLEEPAVSHSGPAPVSRTEGALRPAIDLRPIAGGASDALVAERGIRLWGVGIPIEAIRFAGSNRLLVEFSYGGHRRVVEPYSLRRPRTGNLLLYGFERERDGAHTDDIRAYKVGGISNVQIIRRSFTPRYTIELTERGGVWRW